MSKKNKITNGKMTCINCGVEKETNLFYKNKNSYTGLRMPCKYCISKNNKSKTIKKYANDNIIINLNNEIWVNVKGYEDSYMVSNFGRIKSKDRNVIRLNGFEIFTKGGLRKNSLKKSGYFDIGLWKEGNVKRFSVHKLVAINFIPNPYNNPVINHKNCDKKDNRVENLEWCTHKENIQHSWINGLSYVLKGEKAVNSILTRQKVLAIRRLFKINPKSNQRNIAKKLNVHYVTINNVVNSKTWRHIL